MSILQDQINSAIRVWLECPVDKRPSAQALGIRVAEIAALHSTSAAGETTSSDGCCSGSLPSGESDPVVTQDWHPSEAIPVDVLAMKEACKQIALEHFDYYSEKHRAAVMADDNTLYQAMSIGMSASEKIAAAIDKLSPEVKAEGGRVEPVAWMRHKVDGDGHTHCNEDDDGAFLVYPASPPDVEAIRADERERCARIAEATKVTSSGHPQIDAPTPGDMQRAIASAIRTGGQK